MTIPRILVVDDDPGIQRLVKTILTREKFEVDIASDGDEAIRKLAADAGYDLVLLDLMMPKVDGLGVFAYIQQNQRELADRTVIMTAFPQAAVQRLGFVCPIVSKPFDVNDVVELVRAQSEVVGH